MGLQDAANPKQWSRLVYDKQQLVSYVKTMQTGFLKIFRVSATLKEQPFVSHWQDFKKGSRSSSLTTQPHNS